MQDTKNQDSNISIPIDAKTLCSCDTVYDRTTDSMILNLESFRIHTLIDEMGFDVTDSLPEGFKEIWKARILSYYLSHSIK